MNKIFNQISSLKIDDFNSYKDDILKLDSNEDIVYLTTIRVFESSNINHKRRFFLLKKILSISKKYKLNFCIAHNLTVSIKVSKELGQIKSIIEDSHKAINSWSKVLSHKLGINGLIFSYVDLALIYLDNKLFLLSLKYLDKANSLLSECSSPYNPYKKLYVAYAMLYDSMGKEEKSKKYYSQVIKKAKLEDDLMTIIPITINMSYMLLKNKKNLNNIDKNVLDALKISNDLNDNIYRPHIYQLLGQIYLKQKKFTNSKKNFKLSLNLFNQLNAQKMLPGILFNISKVYFKQNKKSIGKKYLFDSLDKCENLDNHLLYIEILEKICSIYKDKKLYHKKLISALKKQSNNNLKTYALINKESIKQLSIEYDLQLKKQIDLALKAGLESKKREKVSKTLRKVSEKEFLSKLITLLSLNNNNNFKLIQLCKERLNKTKGWNIFMKLFNEINPDFTGYIINKCSYITETELRVCNLIKMGFSTVEISEILAITNRGVEQHRYRIKKKLKLKGDLTIFLRSL
tara:strand:+ start:10997 stop:12547 length:1551 start_codon:yes stop_codon:yes gene_type:complete